MGLVILVTFALLAQYGRNQAQASPLAIKATNRPCTTFKIPVPITAQQHVYDLVHVNSNIDAVDYELDMDTWDSPSIFERIVQNVTISKTYDIHAMLCVPPAGSKKNYLQIATHGAGFDSRYWDPEIDPQQHSYVDAALNAGYSILTYDRLGCGQSSKPDAYTELQAQAEIEILRGISGMVRSNKLSDHTSNSIAFDKIITVGHSFGSIISYSLISSYANLSDAAILTGFIPSREFSTIGVTINDFQYTLDADPQLFAGTSSGYIVTGTREANQVVFFSSRANKTLDIGGFEPALLDCAWSLRQPRGVAELGSGVVALAGATTAPDYTGPVQLMTGEFDFAVCGGDCRKTFDPEMVPKMFPKAKGVDVYLQPGTGHGMPFHNNATIGFEKTFQWLEKNGL